MTSYNFPINQRLPLTISTSSCGSNNTTSISGVHASVLHPPPPPPSTTGHLMAMHHHLLGTTRPILIGHQGFSLPHNHHQFFNEGMYTPRNVSPAHISSGLNDSPLDFNISRNKLVSNEPAVNCTERIHIQNFKSVVDIQNFPSKNDVMKNKNQIESNTGSDDALNKVIRLELADDDCQVISEIRPNVVELGVSEISATNSSLVPSQNMPSLTSNTTPIWSDILPHVNISMLGVNHMLPSNTVDSNVFSGQTLGIFGNVLSQLPTNTANTDFANSTNKTIIHYKNCSLFPPHSNAPVPTTRDRPFGCKTVFVGGLPENIKGYRIRLGSNSDPPNTGRLHVDFAHARDDQFEWECKQRQVQREQRHKERLFRENFQDIVPSGFSHFTESEANSVLEKLKSEDTFLKAIAVAVCWLDRGECNKRNVNTFYSMIQSVNSHIRRLLHDKNQCESEFIKSKEFVKSKAQAIFTQFAQIEKLFVSSSHKKVWDHFTKAQRKNIEFWKKTAMEIKKLPVENEEIVSDEMDFSDSDSDEKSYKKKKLDLSETNSLKDENDSLRCQLEAYKNEICVVRSELQCEISRKNEQLVILQNSLNNVNQKLENIRNRSTREFVSTDIDSSNEKAPQEADSTAILSSKSDLIVEKEAKLIGLISVFLHIHPFGAGIDYIYSFLQKTIPTLKVSEIDCIMKKCPSIFQQEIVGIGACMERRWKYAGFKTENELPIV